MYSPPAARTTPATGRRSPIGSGRIPSEENRLSAMNAASRTPCRFMSAIAAYPPGQGFAVVVGSWCRDRPHRTAQRDGRARLGEISAAAAVTPW
jgi:hypothetical protein